MFADLSSFLKCYSITANVVNADSWREIWTGFKVKFESQWTGSGRENKVLRPTLICLAFISRKTFSTAKTIKEKHFSRLLAPPARRAESSRARLVRNSKTIRNFYSRCLACCCKCIIYDLNGIVPAASPIELDLALNKRTYRGARSQLALLYA